jgi:hypothetical protein
MRALVILLAVFSTTGACSTWPPKRTEAAEEDADRRLKMARRRYHALQAALGDARPSPKVARALERVGSDIEIADDGDDWAKCWAALVEAEELLDAAHAPPASTP